MIRRSLTLFAGLFVLILVDRLAHGPALHLAAPGARAAAYALIALGLNIQWGYGGLFNFGIMGFLMLGGFAVTFISYPINPQFWGSDGPWMLGRALIAFAAGALLVLGRAQEPTASASAAAGRRRSPCSPGSSPIASIAARSTRPRPISRPMPALSAGWALHPVLGWLFGGVLAAGIAYHRGQDRPGAAHRLSRHRHDRHFRDHPRADQEHGLADARHADRVADSVADAAAAGLPGDRLGSVLLAAAGARRLPAAGVARAGRGHLADLARLCRALGPHDAGHPRQPHRRGLDGQERHARGSSKSSSSARC